MLQIFWTAVYASALLSGFASSTQVPVNPDSFRPYSQSYDSGLFTPVESLNALSESSFTTLRHPLFPNYGVRIKQSRFCDESVRSYTGYIDVEARHLFFYFFESRSSPDKDDVIMWTEGGPGCSSSIGLFMGLGPCRISEGNNTTFHPESWNSNANIFFIDQPIGVGFSYADYGETVSTSEEGAKDIAAFMAIFFENFNQFKGRAFHMSGSAYAGRYLPVYASAVYDQNARLVEAGMTPINLQSVIIGNGMVDYYTLLLAWYDIQCTPAAVAPVVDIASCVVMKAALPRCERWMKASCIDQFDSMNCRAASSFCTSMFTEALLATGRNIYDITVPCEGGMENHCYGQIRTVTEYLRDPSLRSLLGVDHSIAQNLSACSTDVEAGFEASQDILHPTTDYIAALLDRNVRVLIYVGTYDLVCNHVGTERWSLKLEWSGQPDFVSQELRDWYVDGKKAGHTRSAKGFTFATVDGGGHIMTAFNKPKESLALLQRWLAGEGL